MNKLPSLSRTHLIIILALICCAVVSFVIRALPALQMNIPSYEMIGDPDSWYTLRQIEVLVAQFPQYNWFDAMTAYPSGKMIGWGPLYPLFASIFSIMFGATTRPDILYLSSWIPVFFGISMVPVIFFLGREVADWKSGIIAAIFISIIPGEYYFRSLFGLVDHHIAEVFFTTLFCLFYIYALKGAKDTRIGRDYPIPYKEIIIPSLLAGIALGAGLLVAPTCILFAVIVAIFTLLLYIWNVYHNRKTDYIVIINTIISLCAIVSLLITGLPSPDFSLSSYSTAQVYIFILLILGTVFLQISSMVTKGKPHYFVASIIIAGIIGIALLTILEPLFITTITRTISSFFIRYDMLAIAELQPITFQKVWANFNIGIILAAIGLILASYTFVKKQYPEYLFLATWSTVVLLITIQHVRWLYYSSVIVALLSGYVLGYALILDVKKSEGGSKKVLASSGSKGKKTKKRSSEDSEKPKNSHFKKMTRTGTVLVLTCIVIFSGISLYYDSYIASNIHVEFIPSEWVDSLEWMERSTPDTGISYFGPYSDEWVYPPGSYGILTWWDSGHWITFIGKRIPVTNPFQDNARASAAFFLAESEEHANTIANSYGVKYVITDWQMPDTIFRGIVRWNNVSRIDGYYSQPFFIRPHSKDGRIASETLLASPYYLTMVSRLHNFDGSMTQPTTVAYIEILKSSQNQFIPTVTAYEELDIKPAQDRMHQFEMTEDGEVTAKLMGISFGSPLEPVSALRHYRLVYETAGISGGQGDDFGRQVKTFEYVKGARVKGEGTIEVTIQTNLGREFVYRQKSEQGLFILPYPTRNSSYPVHAIGPYRMLPSGRTIEIDESDVVNGITVYR